MWETHTHPSFGGGPQEIINRQIVHHIDFGIGVFWTRLGTPTKVALSGSVEEIERLVAADVPFLLYRSQRPAPPRFINPVQLAGVDDLFERYGTQALIAEFSDVAELREKVFADISKLMHDLSLGATPEEENNTPMPRFPSSYVSKIRQAFAIDIFGVDQTDLVTRHFNDIRHAIEHGACVRIILVSPKGAAAAMATKRFPGNPPVRDVRSRIASAVRRFCELQRGREGSVEIRLINYLLGHGGIITYDKLNNTTAFVKRYTYRTRGGSEKPKCVYTGDSDMLTLVQDEFEEMWQDSDVVKPALAGGHN